LMPYGNANAIVREMASEVLTAVRHTPVLAGVCATDPFLIRDPFLRELQDLGFAGIQNFPTVGLVDGVFRANLEETGMGFDLEVEMVRLAAERGLLTAPYVFDVEQAEAMTRAGADVLVPHMGLTTKGSIGARTAKTLDDSYPPDSRIVETAVAKELGTSQAPVREALRGLEALGIVEITPFRGARVRRLDSDELLEAYVVRSTIEVLGARLAMARLTDA